MAKTPRPTMKIVRPTSRSASRPAQEEEAAEGEDVAVDHPGEVVLGDVEVAADRGKRDVHDRGVEHHHELRGREQRERQPLRDGS
jgi:hypothetical protein